MSGGSGGSQTVTLGQKTQSSRVVTDIRSMAHGEVIVAVGNGEDPAWAV